MSGLARAVPARKSAGTRGLVQQLTLDNPAGWTTGADVIGLSTDRAMKISTVSSCVEVRSNSVAVLPCYVMNEGTKERLDKHRLAPLLWGNVNEAMTRFDYEKLMEANKLLRGNAYAWIYRDRGSGYARELVPLPPECVTPYIDDRGKLWYVFFHPRTGDMTRLDPQDVLHYKEYSDDGIEGVSVLRRAAMTLSTAQAAQRYENDLYLNGGRPSGVLKTDTDLNSTKIIPDGHGGTEEVTLREIVRRSWEKVHSGPGNQFRVCVLDMGLEYQAISPSNADTQFVESEDVRVADICRFFRTPPHLVYSGKQSYQSNEANGLDFVKYTLQPDVSQREQEDTAKLLVPSERAAGLRIKREMKVFLRGDSAAQSNWYRTLHELGAYSVNDILALEDRPAVPGGDARYASLNYVPLEDWGNLSRQRAEGGNGGD